MKNGWQIKNLGDVATIGAGNSAPQDDALFENGIIPISELLTRGVFGLEILTKPKIT